MHTHAFDMVRWRQWCSACAARCAERAMTPMHGLLILGQAIDDGLRRIPAAQHALAVGIAREFGYETPEDRNSMTEWLRQKAPARVSVYQ